MSSSFTRSLAREEDRKRKDVLAELDRQKIAFFQNISHELRSMFTVTCIFVYYVNDVFDIIFRMSYPRSNQYVNDYKYVTTKLFYLGPLTLMLSPLDEATELCSENSPILDHLKLIRNSNRRLLNLVDNLLQVRQAKMLSSPSLLHRYCLIYYVSILILVSISSLV